MFGRSDLYDNAVPSANSVAAQVLMKISIITNNDEYKNISEQLIKTSINLMNKYPNASGNWLCNLSYYMSKVKEIVVIGDPSDKQLVDLKFQIHKNFMPNKIIIGKDSTNSKKNELDLLLFHQKSSLNNKPTIYICENYQCKLPVTTKDELVNQLID